MYDLKIVNGIYPDFRNKDLVRKNIYIKNDKIKEISLENKKAEKTIDAEGSIVSPGFIDIHMHEEELDTYDTEEKYYIGNRMLRMGVTTCLTGNCGINYQDPEIFIKETEKDGYPVNYMMKLGHNYLRKEAGIESPYREAEKNELIKMKEIAEEKLKLGLKGISFGIEYQPGISFEEMLELTKVLKEDNRYFISAHYRSDGPDSVDSIKEMIKLGKESGLLIEISHIGSCSAFGFMKEALKEIRKAKDNGVKVSADCYPYDAFCTHIGSTVFDDGCFERWNSDYSDILLTDKPYKNIRCTKEIFEDARKNHPNMLAVAFVMNEKEVIEAYNEPYMIVASDGIYNGNSGHPRGAGTFPRFLGRYVRNKKDINMLDALKKMTLMPADILGLKNKGKIEEGKDADLVIFNPNLIDDNADFVNDPTAGNEGIKNVIIKGKIALEDGVVKKRNLGRFIKNKI